MFVAKNGSFWLLKTGSWELYTELPESMDVMRFSTRADADAYLSPVAHRPDEVSGTEVLAVTDDNGTIALVPVGDVEPDPHLPRLDWPRYQRKLLGEGEEPQNSPSE